MKRKIGVLGLQGDFREHVQAIARCGGAAVVVRLPEEVSQVDGLIIPGGESTTIGKLMVRFGLIEPVQAMAREGKPILGTCAGMILMAREIEGSDQPRLGVMDITVRRNDYGRQVESFEDDLEATEALGGGALRGVFIRAPRIAAMGPGVEILGTYQGEPVLVRQGRLLAAAFHPELTEETRVHRLLLD